jgi:hypothetical protein
MATFKTFRALRFELFSANLAEAYQLLRDILIIH